MTTKWKKEFKNKRLRESIAECCPWCGHSQRRGGYRVHKGRAIIPATGVGRVPRQWDDHNFYVRPIRVSKKRTRIRHTSGAPRTSIPLEDTTLYRHCFVGPRSRTWAECTHPFHDKVAEEPHVIPAKEHHPDLTQDKKFLKRQLQGKDRK